MMSIILPPSNAFLVLTSFATFILRVRNTRCVKILSQRESIVLEQPPGDHARSEWNDQQGCLVGGMPVAERLPLVSGYYSDVNGCSNQFIYAT